MNVVNGAQVFLRNRHPTRPLAVPLGNGWSRVVPRRVLPPVVAGLAAEQLAVVIEVNAGTDARAFTTLRRDMVIAIARAKQRLFDKLLRGLPSYRKPPRPDRANAPYTLLKAAAASAGMPTTTLSAVLNRKLPLPASLKLHIEPASQPERKTATALNSVHWRRRNDLAATLLLVAYRDLQHISADGYFSIPNGQIRPYWLSKSLVAAAKRRQPPSSMSRWPTRKGSGAIQRP